LRGESYEALSLESFADVAHYGDGFVELYVVVLEEGEAHVEAYFYLVLAIDLVHDVLEINLQVVEQVPYRLASSPDEEVVQLQNTALLRLLFYLSILHIIKTIEIC
jgi:tRNA isopentenyl-2-thiomethyl-A-37 hydroxylase MiaE